MTKNRFANKPALSADERPPDAELEVLACLWQRGEATARQVRETLSGYRPMAHGAIVTLLKRLESKNLVVRRKGPVGKAFLYRPTRSADPTYRRVVGDMLERIFGGNGVRMVTALLDAKPPTQEELSDLHQLIDELELKAQKREKEK